MLRYYLDTAANCARHIMTAMRPLSLRGVATRSASMSHLYNPYSRIPHHGTVTQRPLALHQCMPYSVATPQPQPQPKGHPATDHTPDQASDTPADFATAKPFSAIPSPKRIPLIGMSRDFMKQSPTESVRNVRQRVEELGKIYREKLVPGLPEFVFVLDPEDVAKVFRADGRHPQRFPISEWTTVRKELNIPIGLFLSNGESWESQRKPISKFMLVPRKLAEYHESFNEVALDLIDVLRKERGRDDVFLDVPGTMNRWSFESIGVFVLGKRLGCLEEEVPADCQVFIEELHNFIVVTQDLLFNFPFHKFVTTKNWKALAHSIKCVYDVAMSHIQEKVAQVTEEDKRLLEEGGEDDEPPVGVDFVTFMMHAGKMDLETIATNAVDLMAGGVDTTSNTLSWTLYCLATNPGAQEKLRREVEEVVGSDKLVTPQHIARMPYLHDCIRETQRFYPIAPNNSRILNEDVVLSGYKVPAGTHIVMPIRVAGTLPDNFPDPDEFKPERWSRKNKDAVNVFGSLPFGFGVRMCVGRRIAELEMHIALAQLIRNFNIEYRDEQPLNFIQKLFVYPERQMDLAFVDRK